LTRIANYDYMGRHRGCGGEGFHLGGIEEQLLTPHQPGLDALLDDSLEEAPEDPQAEAFADAGERRMVGQRLEEVVAQVSPHREAIRDHPHELAFGAQILEEHHQLCSLKKTTGSTEGLPPLA
jgi:hypothetical protein